MTAIEGIVESISVIGGDINLLVYLIFKTFNHILKT